MYLEDKIEEIMKDEISLDEFIKCINIRPGKYKCDDNNSTPPPHLSSMRKQMELSNRNCPYMPEPSAFVFSKRKNSVKSSESAVPLELVLESTNYLANSNEREYMISRSKYKLDKIHYITKEIFPPIFRIFSIQSSDSINTSAMYEKEILTSIKQSMASYKKYLNFYGIS